MEFLNLDPEVYVLFKKMISAKLCSTVLGQVCYFNIPFSSVIRLSSMQLSTLLSREIHRMISG